MTSRASRHPPSPLDFAVMSLLIVASPVLSPELSGQELARRADALAAEHASTAVDLRHRIHRNPELSNREYETAALVAEHLENLGYEVRTGVAHTGVVAILRGGRPGPVVALRADMDALPVEERSGLPFASTVRTTYLGQEVGVAHACGHDIHTAVQLGVASVLAALRDDLPGTVKLIFQPAEEGPPPGEEGGASLMIEEGVLADPAPEAIFALHSFPDLEVGELGWVSGPTYASSDHFIATIRGTQSHGAYPHQSVDPVVTAAQAVLALQTIRSRTLDPTEPGVVSVGIIRGGERNNIIPEEVRLEGTIRTYDETVRETIHRRIAEILEGVTRAAGAEYELELIPYAPPTINDPELAARMRPVLAGAVDEGRVVEVEPVMGAEDFAWFAREVPGFYFRLGTREPGGETGGLHTPTFRGDDGAVAVGMRAMTRVVLGYLEG